MFNKILVANRGEIARRIFRACRELNIPSVAIYSEADAAAPWLFDADEAYPLAGVTAADTYLNQSQIFAICAAAGVDAIHPGYGFLSENADFAANCAEHNVTFIGPTPEAMRVMGSKASAREVAQAAGVPITPGVDGAGMTDEQLLSAAQAIGFPLLVKASAGGGGKGMRVVDAIDQLADALQAARSEAANSFGDDHIILERFFTAIHHIEVQVLGDTHGNVLHLFERECSIQRRHQKIIEETPSPNLTPALRDAITGAAVELARSVGYISAGTVEFMLTDDGAFYLLEMNTRLQVEHPITELVTGIDLAAWQIRIAAGEAIGFSQADLGQTGHAIECRVYAEDPATNFLPSIGTIVHYTAPSGPNVRVDDGIATGSDVTPYYDPMLGKIIVWGADRAAAIDKMRQALQQTTVLGVTTNIDYMLDILAEPHFQAGDTLTHYLATHFDGWQPPAIADDDVWLALAAAELLGKGGSTQTSSAAVATGQNDPWQTVGRWRNNA